MVKYEGKCMTHDTGTVRTCLTCDSRMCTWLIVPSYVLHTRAHGLHVAPPLVSAWVGFQQINDKFDNVLYGQQRFPRQQSKH